MLEDKFELNDDGTCAVSKTALLGTTIFYLYVYGVTQYFIVILLNKNQDMNYIVYINPYVKVSPMVL